MNNPNNKKFPSISVLMSCFNGTRWIDKAVTSVLNQSHAVQEFIIVDDGSTDDSLKVISRWAQLDKRIKVVPKDNSGLADSLNFGIGLCTSEWIARIDVDDLWHEDRIKNQIEVIVSNKNIQFISGSMIEIDNYDNQIKHYKYPEDHKQLRNRLLALKGFPPHSSVMYKKSLVEKLGLYRGQIKRAEDHDLWLRMSEVADLNCSNKSVTYIRKHEAQISNESSGLTQLRDAFISVCCAHARSQGLEEPISYSNVDFDKFEVELDKVFEDFQFYRFFSMTRFIKSLLKGKVNRQSDVSLRYAIYYWYPYLFRMHYLKRMATNILNKH